MIMGGWHVNTKSNHTMDIGDLVSSINSLTLLSKTYASPGTASMLISSGSISNVSDGIRAIILFSFLGPVV
jgi:hypothetical protein